MRAVFNEIEDVVGSDNGNSARRRKADSLLLARMVSQIVTNAMAGRASVASKLGQSYGTDRDLYEALGYPKEIEWESYRAKYRREGVSKAVIDKPCRASWRKKPLLFEKERGDTPEGERTEWEQVWDEIVESCQLFNRFNRLDRLASLGQYAVLFLGFDDGKDLEQPVERAKELLYVMPYSEGNAPVQENETDTGDRRFGLPSIYNITFKSTAVGSSGTGGSAGAVGGTRRVHHSRVIHVAEDCLEDNVYGTPRLEAIYNRIIGIDAIAGSSPEMWWRCAFPLMVFKVAADASVGTQDEDALEDKIFKLIHKLERHIRAEGYDIEEITSAVADPKNHIDAQIKLISIATGIPKRILEGSERGELASSMDEISWLDTVDERREDHCGPVIIKPLVNRLIEVRVLGEPRGGFTVDWPDLYERSDKDRAQVAEIVTKAIKNYIDSGAEDLIPPDVFFTEIIGFSHDLVRRALESIFRAREIVDDDGEEKEETKEEAEAEVED